MLDGGPWQSERSDEAAGNPVCPCARNPLSNRTHRHRQGHRPAALKDNDDVRYGALGIRLRLRAAARIDHPAVPSLVASTFVFWRVEIRRSCGEQQSLPYPTRLGSAE